MATLTNHILFPTDFSKNAKRALPYAAEIAHRNNTDLVLFHATQDTMDLSPDYEKRKAQTIKETDRQFNTLIDQLKKDEQYHDLNIKTILQSGHPINSILGQVDENKPELIVMGTKGATADRNALLGSVTTSILKKAEVPVLAVPDGSTFDRFKNIVFTTDYKDGDVAALKETVDFAKLFNSTVVVLHISDRENLLTEIKYRGFRELMTALTNYNNLDFRLEYEYDFFPGMADYIIEHEVSLVVLVRYKKTFWEAFLERNHSREMAFYSKVPVLILPGRPLAEKPLPIEKMDEERHD